MILSLDGHPRGCKSGNQGYQGTYNPSIYVDPVGKVSVNTGLGYIYIYAWIYILSVVLSKGETLVSLWVKGT